MAIKSFKPTTPSQRYVTVADFSVLTPKKKQPSRPKKLTVSISGNGGRNNYGRITAFRQGGGHKRKYRVVDFARDKDGIPGKVVSLEYDPNRSAYLALVQYLDGEKRYILAPLNVEVGSKVVGGKNVDIISGNNLLLEDIPVGTLIHNIELEPGRSGKLVRAAGCFAQLMAKDGPYCNVRMPSGEIRLINRKCRATIGQIGNTDHENITVGKAGRSRWLGIRPTVRGVAMNPIDHPMGGGEGKASGGHPQSPWGTPSKGYKTRKNKRTSAFIVKRKTKKN